MDTGGNIVVCKWLAPFPVSGFQFSPRGKILNLFFIYRHLSQHSMSFFRSQAR